MDRVGSPHWPCRADGEPMHTAERALRAREVDRTAAQNHRITTRTLLSERSTPMRRARLTWSGLDGASRRRTAGRGRRAAGLAAREPPWGPCRWSSASSRVPLQQAAPGGPSPRAPGAAPPRCARSLRSSAAPLRFAAAGLRCGAPLRRCVSPLRNSAAEPRCAAADRRGGETPLRNSAADGRRSGRSLQRFSAAAGPRSGASLLDPASLLPTRLPTQTCLALTRVL